MLEDYEGSRAEFMKMLAEHDAPPAFVARAQRVEAAWSGFLAQCGEERRALQKMCRTRLGQLAQLIDQRWHVLEPYVFPPCDAEYLSQLYAEWTPELRLQLNPTSSSRKLRLAIRDLAVSFERFNRRWHEYVGQLELGAVNYERHQYNDYYLVEKAAAFGSERVAALGFRRLEDLTREDVLKALPLLHVPRELGSQSP